MPYSPVTVTARLIAQNGATLPARDGLTTAELSEWLNRVNAKYASRSQEWNWRAQYERRPGEWVDVAGQ